MMRKKLYISIICLLIAAAATLTSCSLFGDKRPSGASNSHGADSSNIISEEEAKNIVLSRVKGAAENDFKKFVIEDDEGHKIYVGELVYKGIEYDFEIEACNGNILEWALDN